MEIDLNPETYNPEAGWDYSDLNELAIDLGWNSWDEAVQSIARRFGYESWDALLDYYLWDGQSEIDDLEAAMTPAEHIIWHAED